MYVCMSTMLVPPKNFMFRFCFFVNHLIHLFFFFCGQNLYFSVGFGGSNLHVFCWGGCLMSIFWRGEV